MARLEDTSIKGVLDITGDLTLNDIPILDLAHPVGSTMIMSTKTNPSTIYEGTTWELTDKQFGRHYGSSSDDGVYFTPDTKSGKVKSHTTYYQLVGDTLRFRIGITAATDISATGSDSISLGTLNFANLGITGTNMSISREAGVSDDGHAIVNYSLAYNTGELKIRGIIGRDDKGGNTTLKADSVFYINFIVNISPSSKLDSFCNRFYWKRLT